MKNCTWLLLLLSPPDCDICSRITISVAINCQYSNVEWYKVSIDWNVFTDYLFGPSVGFPLFKVNVMYIVWCSSKIVFSSANDSGFCHAVQNCVCWIVWSSFNRWRNSRYRILHNTPFCTSCACCHSDSL